VAGRVDCLAIEVVVGWLAETVAMVSSSLLSPIIEWRREATDEVGDEELVEAKVVVTWLRRSELGAWRVDNGVGSLAVTVAVS